MTMIRANTFFDLSGPALPGVLLELCQWGVRDYQQENFKAALEKFEQIIKFSSTFNINRSIEPMAALYHNCGLLHQELENYPRAELYYQCALNLTNNLPTFLAYATLKEDRGDLGAARQDYYTYNRRVRQGELLNGGGNFRWRGAATGRGAGVNNIGIMHYNADEYDLALSCFADAKLLDPTEAAYYNNSALVLFKQGTDYKTAREHYNIAIMNGFARAELYLHRGICLFYERSYIEAQDDFRKALQLAPADENAKKMAEATAKALRLLQPRRARAA